MGDGGETLPREMLLKEGEKPPGPSEEYIRLVTNAYNARMSVEWLVNNGWTWDGKRKRWVRV